MQTTATAHRASKPKAPAIQALMPLPDHTQTTLGIFWAVQALNEDACLQALEVMATPLYGPRPGSSALHTKQMAFTRALINAEGERDTSFRNCARNGGLLFAWRGSRALLQTLPTSLRGAQ